MSELTAAFVAPGVLVAPVAQPALRAARLAELAAGASVPSFQEQGSTFGKASLFGGLAAAAGLLALAQQKRSSTARRSYRYDEPSIMRIYDSRDDRPIQRGFLDGGKRAVPGSEKALKTLVGSDVETGNEPWDPWGFSKLYDRNFEFNEVPVYPHVQWLREAEVKHGRVCMLAFVGFVVQSFVQITPPYPSEPDWTKALAACYQDKNASIGIAQISGFIMLVEGRFFPFDAWIGQMDREPGDLGFDPLKLTKGANFDLKSMQLKELKNGRLAMIAVAAFTAAHEIPGSVPFLSATRRERPAAAAPALCGQTRAAARPSGESKTEMRYTTQVILPAMAWLKTGVKAKDLAPTELKAKTIAGNDVLIGKDESGKLFCVGNLCPHIGTPMSEGADVIGDIIVCPLHGSSFKVSNGELIDWCPSPPIIGPLTGLVIEKKNLLVFEVRESGFFGGGEIEVLVDTNAKKAYEANYWKGVLDAQGKDDGSYY